MPHIFGAWTGQQVTNAQVAAAYQAKFVLKGVKLDAQLMATALSVYATDSSLGGNGAAAYGFQVSQYGLGNATYNVGSNGAAFDVDNNTTLTVMDILLAADRFALNGILYYDLNTAMANAMLRKMANSVFAGINESGDID